MNNRDRETASFYANIMGVTLAFILGLSLIAVMLKALL